MWGQFFPFLLYISLISCTKPAVFSSEEAEAIRYTVSETLRNYYQDVAREGLLAEFKYLDHSSDFFWVPPGFDSAISYDSVATILRQNAGKYKSINNSFSTLKIIPLSKDIALYTGRLRSVMIDTSGASLEADLLESGTLIRRLDGWKLLAGQTTLVTK
jgi:hypothetical protein